MSEAEVLVRPEHPNSATAIWHRALMNNPELRGPRRRPDLDPAARAISAAMIELGRALGNETDQTSPSAGMIRDAYNLVAIAADRLGTLGGIRGI